MKLKSKLIATIVSMCAAIAVMGVGVWASTSQNFTVTIKNDIDVKILSVSADVYGEFATYTQFVGQGNATNAAQDGITPTYAQKYTRDANTNHTDCGYLLYAKELGRVDGVTGTADAEYDYTRATNSYGYNRYVNQTKDEVLFATSNGTLENNNSDDAIDRTGNDWYKENFNVDFTTHTAQIAYMYTIRQWGKSSATGATNLMYLDVATSRSTDAETKLAGAGQDAKLQTNIFIAQGAETGNLAWYDMTTNHSVIIPDSVDTTTYYVLVLYTFARNSSNLDLSRLSDALTHTFTLEAERTSTTGYVNFGAEISNETTTLVGVTGRAAGKAYNVTAAAFNPSYAPAQVLVDGTDGTTATDRTTEVVASNLPLGYISSGTIAGGTGEFTPNSTLWGFVKNLNEGKQVS